MSNLHATTDAVKRDGRWLDLVPAAHAWPLRFDITNVDRDAALFRDNELELVSRIFASWNQLDRWLRQVEGLRRVA